jgi:hypothetical protein
MKRHHNPTRTRKQVMQVWTHAQAQKAVPLIASIVASIREHRLETQAQHLRAERLARRPGRPDRATLIAQEEALQAMREANERFEGGLKELFQLNVYCLYPVQGLALLPFAHAGQLAWFVFNLFEPEPLQSWRYHADPLTTRRPLAELEANNTTDSFFV